MVVLYYADILFYGRSESEEKGKKRDIRSDWD